MAGSVLGNRVIRKEDPKFITTGGVYVGDLHDVPELDGAAYVAYVRSSVAHGIVTAIDADEARSMPGVIGVYTAADLGLQPDAASFNPGVARPLLASERVRFVGEPVAAVVAETFEQAADAVSAVIVDYDVLEAYVDPEQALTGTTLLYEGAGSNVVMDTTAMGMPDLSGDEYFADCEVVVEGRFVNQRVAPCPLETRAAAAAWVDGRLVQWVSTQHAQGIRDRIAAVNGLDASAVRVITPDVGGGFGAKIGVYAEEVLLGGIATAAGRPVRWTETRSESMMALGHGRAQIQYVKLGGRRDGRVTHYQLRVIQDCGGFMDMGAILAPFMTRPMASGVYDIANIECRTTSVLTNTTPTVAYRGAGRPEATAAIERGMDLYAAELGLDPTEVRRINLIAPFTEPHTTVIGQTYDVGDYVGALDRALAAVGYDELRADQQRRRDAGDPVQLGIGVSVYVEITGGVPPFGDNARIDIADDGTATVYTGTSPHGQGHDTAFSMITSARTGIDIHDIRLVWGDTDLVPTGGGTMGSRSLQQGGAAVDKAAGELVEAAKALAATVLEADVADIVLDVDRGAFHVAGTPAVATSWAELAVAVAADGGRLGVDSRFDAVSPTFPFGAHVAVVEVDTDTGRVRHVRHVAVDDAGTIINPLLLEGQIHGGIAQGTAQALLEEVRFDDDGNPVTSNLADYAMVSAAELPSFEVVEMETPTPVNPLGAKGVGESGTIGSTPAVQSAVVDAVAHLGVRHIDMPTTPERVWSAIRAVS
ncbi:xanthine dehydrogenase family protein molybdopterin-binding subunit [Desertimonas flava]|uniref:xanthine dehydrogenase family protein molybdopterin-binding subunit n=1 Tax=Desertimonas flava TaxID=2064846 RepID=UPI001D0C3F2C|nr:xanthine dehydrogenase family protein molybdopterin-binding subunit [Desertimonas flava]